MSGARILLAVLLFAALLLWAALTGGRDADLERGHARTDEAFAAVEAELTALDPDYQALRSQGLVLGLRDQRDELLNRLAGLKSRRVQLTQDTSQDKRLRLPALQGLVDEADVVLALAVSLHRECTALVEWRRQSQSLLAEASSQRNQLAARKEQDPARRARIESLATGLGEIERQVPMVERLLHDNLEQGRLLGDSVTAKLHTLLEEQARLLRP